LLLFQPQPWPQLKRAALIIARSCFAHFAEQLQNHFVSALPILLFDALFHLAF